MKGGERGGKGGEMGRGREGAPEKSDDVNHRLPCLALVHVRVDDGGHSADHEQNQTRTGVKYRLVRAARTEGHR